MFSRRDFALSGVASLAFASTARSESPAFHEFLATFEALEKQNGGRVGVAAFDTRSGRRIDWRGDERFPLTSTFKLLAAAAVLSRADAGVTALEKIVRYEQRDLVAYSPVTKDFAGRGMTLDALCEAAITMSDNTAGNLLLREIGGPPGIGVFARTLGDRVTRLDRWETGLNEASPGDVRDTTSPRAMLGDIERLVLGDALEPASREKLVGWLKGCKTGAERMRARLPAGWIVGDKTGAGERGTMNDVGVIWPPDGAAVLLTIYSTGSGRSVAERAAVIQEVGRAVALFARP